MRYWGVDIGKERIVGVARADSGEIELTHSAADYEEIAAKIHPGDVVACEWTGGRGRLFLELLWAKGVTDLYIYKGNLRADRLHLGYDRKGDVPDAATISYAVWATFQPGVPFRPNALLDYARMRSVYVLRTDLSIAEQYSKERRRWEQRREALIAKGFPRGTYERVMEFLRQQEADAWDTLKHRCLRDESVVQVLRILHQFFPHAERAAIKLALYLAPLDRFCSADALRRYCGVVPESSESANKVVYRKRGRGGCKQARSAMYQLLMPCITIGNGVNGGRRGKWRDYYDRLRRRLSDGEAWIRMMYRLLNLIWKAYERGEYGTPLPVERRISREAKTAKMQEEVLIRVLQGMRDNEIARELGIDRSTITKWKRRDDTFWQRYERAREEAVRRKYEREEATQNDSDRD